MQLDGIDLWSVGRIDLGSNSISDSSSSSITLKNMRSFGRVEIVLPNLHASLDHVPPPAEWGVPAEQVPEMSHVNIKFHSITIADDANGIIGCTVRVKKDQNGQPLLTAYDKNGGGVLGCGSSIMFRTSYSAQKLHVKPWHCWALSTGRVMYAECFVLTCMRMLLG